MKASFILSLIFIFLTCNLFAQTDSTNLQNNSLTSGNVSFQIDSSKSSDSTISSSGVPLSKTKKNKSKNTSSKDSGILIGTVVGAAAGVGIAAFLGSFSLEPSNSKKASLGELILGGLIGGVLGGIIGGLISK